MHILALLVSLGGCLAFAVIVVAIASLIVVINVQILRAQKRGAGAALAADWRRRQEQLGVHGTKLPRSGYCRRCGMFIGEVSVCESSMRLRVRPLEFDPVTGKRWYENYDENGVKQYGYCLERDHGHSLLVDMYYLCLCTRDLDVQRGYDFDGHVRILGPSLVDGDHVALCGPCKTAFCPSCGEKNPTGSSY